MTGRPRISRYQALRRMKCDVITAAFIAFLNFMFDVPPNKIVFMTLEIDFDDEPSEEVSEST